MNMIKELWKTGKSIFFAEKMKVEINEILIFFNRIFKTEIATSFYYDIKIKDEIKESILTAIIDNKIFANNIHNIIDDKVILN